MKNNNIFYIIILVLLTLLFFQNSCNKSKKLFQTYNIKEIKGKLDTIYLPSEIKYKTTFKYITRFKDTLLITDKINDSLARNYESSKDTIFKLKEYLKAIGKNDYNVCFEDDNIKIDNYIETQGTLLKVAPKYTIKSKLDSIKIKEQIFALYSGLEVSNNTLFTNPNIKVNFFIQNKKGNIISTGYDLDKNIYLGYNFKIFNIKK